MEKLTVTIAVHNSGENFDIKLTEIYNKAKQLFETTGYDHNYFAYISSNFKSGKVIHIKNERINFVRSMAGYRASRAVFMPAGSALHC